MSSVETTLFHLSCGDIDILDVDAALRSLEQACIVFPNDAALLSQLQALADMMLAWPETTTTTAVELAAFSAQRLAELAAPH